MDEAAARIEQRTWEQMPSRVMLWKLQREHQVHPVQRQWKQSRLCTSHVAQRRRSG